MATCHSTLWSRWAYNWDRFVVFFFGWWTSLASEPTLFVRDVSRTDRLQWRWRSCGSIRCASEGGGQALREFLVFDWKTAQNIAVSVIGIGKRSNLLILDYDTAANGYIVIHSIPIRYVIVVANVTRQYRESLICLPFRTTSATGEHQWRRLQS